jgi:hypothetical protein
MDKREMVKSIPKPLKRVISDKLIDVMLEAKDGSKVPSSLAKTILSYWQRDQLASEAGLINLLQAVEYANPLKAASVLDDFGLVLVSESMRASL